MHHLYGMIERDGNYFVVEQSFNSVFDVAFYYIQNPTLKGSVIVRDKKPANPYFISALEPYSTILKDDYDRF